MLVRYNSSYYRYTASYTIWKGEYVEEFTKTYYDTEILYNKLHFWNKDRYLRKYRNLLIEEIFGGGQVTAIELLEDEFVLMPRYIYEFCD